MSKPATLDLASLDTVAASNRGVEIELKHPVTGEGLGQFVSILGKESDAFKAHARRNVNQRLRREAEAKRRGREPEPLTMEQFEAEAVELLIACTCGFRNVNLGGPLEFNEANARKLYAVPWIKQQVDEAIGDIELFLKA